jgi:acetyl-CoA C-acetyltransferase
VCFVEETVIVSACRTPIGKYLGGLSSMSATDLGAVAIKEALARSHVPLDQIDECIMGNVLQAGVGQAPARQAALKAGLPTSISALTVNKVCGSGLQAVMTADLAIRAGEAQVIVAGGMESMSGAPFLLPGVRAGWKFGDQKAIDAMLHDGLTCAFEHCAMGMHAEHTARSVKISREDQDRFALSSQQKAAMAIQTGVFAEEIVPVAVGTGKRATTISADEGPRPDTTLEGLAKLAPAFDPTGTVTAGNASTLSDGAAALVVASRQSATNNGWPIWARIVSHATFGVDPKDLFIAPIGAIRKAVEKAKLPLSQVELFEINEAFASQMVACIRGLEIPESKVNVHGGAIALGHPIGASGARVLVTLLHTLRRKNLRWGCAALCLGGGNAVAMVIERLE